MHIQGLNKYAKKFYITFKSRYSEINNYNGITVATRPIILGSNPSAGEFFKTKSIIKEKILIKNIQKLFFLIIQNSKQIQIQICIQSLNRDFQKVIQKTLLMIKENQKYKINQIKKLNYFDQLANFDILN
ncbi:hypothetical protein ABPG72_017672 [Tetrahymena utriculariae]